MKQAKSSSTAEREGKQFAMKWFHPTSWGNAAYCDAITAFAAGWKAAQRDARKAKPKSRPASPLPPTSIVVIGGGGGGGSGKPIKFKEVGEWKPLPKPAGKAKKGRAK